MHLHSQSLPLMNLKVINNLQRDCIVQGAASTHLPVLVQGSKLHQLPLPGYTCTGAAEEAPSPHRAISADSWAQASVQNMSVSSARDTPGRRGTEQPVLSSGTQSHPPPSAGLQQAGSDRSFPGYSANDTSWKETIHVRPCCMLSPAQVLQRRLAAARWHSVASTNLRQPSVWGSQSARAFGDSPFVQGFKDELFL